jgi:hypothetical protein
MTLDEAFEEAHRNCGRDSDVAIVISIPEGKFVAIHIPLLAPNDLLIRRVNTMRSNQTSKDDGEWLSPETTPEAWEAALNMSWRPA